MVKFSWVGHTYKSSLKLKANLCLSSEVWVCSRENLSSRYDAWMSVILEKMMKMDCKIQCLESNAFHNVSVVKPYNLLLKTGNSFDDKLPVWLWQYVVKLIEITAFWESSQTILSPLTVFWQVCFLLPPSSCLHPLACSQLRILRHTAPFSGNILIFHLPLSLTTEFHLPSNHSFRLTEALSAPA